jgi:magnesium transporter
MLINCVVYQNGVKLAAIPVEEISDYLQRPECFIWVSLSDPSDAELDQMQAEFGLHDLAVEDAKHGHQRPKFEEYGEAFFLVMHMLDMKDDELASGEVSIFVGRQFVVSVRSRSDQHFLGVRERCEREPELLKLGPGFVLYALMDAVVDRYFPLVDKLESELEEIEEHIFEKGNVLSNIAQLYTLKRKVMIVKHAVAPLMDAAGKLHGGLVPPPCANSQEYFRDVYDHLVRINTALDSVRDTISTAILVCQSTAGIEQNDVNKKLAAWAAIFAVATAFAGIWGMNFEVMPELHWRYGYALALAVIAASGGYLYYRFKRSGWL